MSLIFNALKKNRSGSVVERSLGKTRLQRKSLTLRALLLSPVIVLMLAFTILISGIVVSYIIKSYTAMGASDSSSVNIPTHQYTVFSPDADAPVQDRPAGHQPEEWLADSPLEEVKPVEKAKAPGGESMGVITEMPDTADVDKAPSGTLINDQASMPDQCVKVSSGSDSSPSMEVSMMHSMDSRTAVPDLDIRSEPLTDDSIGHVQDNPPNPSGKSALEMQRKKSAKEHLQTNQLAGQIMEAIQTGDSDSVTRLFSKMENIKGQNHHFVLKLKAYWMIQQKRLDQARVLLSGALILYPEDLEAGLNMAVVDIMEEHYDQARIRLEKLQQLYPEESTIAEYLSQLAP